MRYEKRCIPEPTKRMMNHSKVAENLLNDLRPCSNRRAKQTPSTFFANLVLATRSTTLRERSTDSLTPVRSPGAHAGLTVYVVRLPSAPFLRPTAVLGGTQKAKCPMGLTHRAFRSGDVLLSHSLSPYYHRGCSVSLPCSEWERVGPLRYCHQKFAPKALEANFWCVIRDPRFGSSRIGILPPNYDSRFNDSRSTVKERQFSDIYIQGT